MKSILNRSRRSLLVCDVRAILLLLVVAALGGIAFYFYHACFTIPDSITSVPENDSLKIFATEMREADSVRKSKRMHVRSTLFPFDPNHADSVTLVRVGLRPWQVRNLMRYRAKGGYWRSPNDFARLYGLSQEEFERLRPYIRIVPRNESRMHGEKRKAGEHPYRRDTLRYPKIEKFPEGTVVDLNTADTTLLKQVPGIGTYTARKIVRYREALGGFISVAQLNEIEDLPSELLHWFSVDETPPRRIPLNHANFKQINRHPYISYEQTIVIVNHIRKFGPVHSWRDLSLYKEFEGVDFKKLEPYFEF